MVTPQILMFHGACYQVRCYRVWFLSSIGANAPQSILTLNFGGRGFVYLCLSKFLMQKHVHHISWNLSANGCHTLEQHEQHAVGKTHSQWLEFHFDHPEPPQRASFRFELQNTLWEQNSKDWSMDYIGLYQDHDSMMHHDGPRWIICIHLPHCGSFPCGEGLGQTSAEKGDAVSGAWSCVCWQMEFGRTFLWNENTWSLIDRTICIHLHHAAAYCCMHHVALSWALCKHKATCDCARETALLP